MPFPPKIAPKPPVVLGGIDTTKDPLVQKQAPPQVKKYGAGVAERAAATRAAKPPIGDLAAANQAYKPERDGKMTIGQITESHRRATAPDGTPSALSPGSLELLGAVKKAADESASKKENKMADQIPTPPTPTPDTQPNTSTKAEGPAAKEDKEALLRRIDDLDDLEYEQVMRSIQKDVIQNTKERDHVKDPANKRISEIDFATGVATGEFTQWVEVVPSKLRVLYRTVTAMELQAARLWLFNMTQQDPRNERLASEIYGLAVLVLSVVQINTTKEVDHLKRNGQGTWDADFDEKAFEAKYKKYSRMPQPLLHALGTHGQWFDLRVRENFTSDFAKNG